MKTIKELEDIYNIIHDYLELDPMSLDTACFQQASLYSKASEAYAEAADLRDSCEEELKTYEAELFLDAKKNKDKMVDKAADKISDVLAKQFVTADKKRVTYLDRYLEANRIANLCYGLTKSFDHRLEMLKVLGYNNNKTEDFTIKEQSYYDNRNKLRTMSKSDDKE